MVFTSKHHPETTMEAKVKMLGSWWVVYWDENRPFDVVHLKAHTEDEAKREVIARNLERKPDVAAR